jgi:hypothetical protein
MLSQITPVAEAGHVADRVEHPLQRLFSAKRQESLSSTNS